MLLRLRIYCSLSFPKLRRWVPKLWHWIGWKPSLESRAEHESWSTNDVLLGTKYGNTEHSSDFFPAIRTSQVNMREQTGVNQRGVQQPSVTIPPMITQGFNHGSDIPAVPPWTWQNTCQTVVTQMYYHPVLNANPYYETYLPHHERTYTSAIPGVNVVRPNKNMNWNTNGSGHQYADAVLRWSKLELPLFEMAGTPRE